MTDRILIVGTGLIGGSVGLGLRRAGAGRLGGYDADAARAEEAGAAGAVDEVVTDLEAGMAAADVVVVATPVAHILEVVEVAASHARPGVVVTDVGSTKATIVREAERLLGADRAFVGGHPMAGTEGRGSRRPAPSCSRARCGS